MNAPVDPYPYLSAILGKVPSEPRVSPRLNKLIEQKINISPGLRSIASDSQNHLREFLRAESERDGTFPPILAKADNDFLGGSFARHTKIWPLDDIDLYLPLEGANLFYVNNGLRLPYAVLSDGPQFGNRLLLPRWSYGLYVSSAKLIDGFATVLQRQYPRTVVRPNRQAVSIRMTHGQTEDEGGLGYDVVPCFSLKPDTPNEFEFYLMPDGNNGWIRTNPKLDTDLAEILQRSHNGFYRPVVKLTKYWNEERLNGAFSSYYIELLLSRTFWTLKQSGSLIGSVSQGLAISFQALESAYRTGDQPPWIGEAPPVPRPTLSRAEQVTLTLARTAAQKAFGLERAGREGEAAIQWAHVFAEPL